MGIFLSHGLLQRIIVQSFTPMGKTKNANFSGIVSFGLLQYNTTNKGSRPEIQTSPGGRGRGEGIDDEGIDDETSQHHQQGTPAHRDNDVYFWQDPTCLEMPISDKKLPKGKKLIDILEFEGDESRGKTLTSLVLTRAKVRSKRILLSDN